MHGQDQAIQACPRCQDLDEALSKADQGDIPATGSAIITIGTLRKKIECHVCRFFFAHAASYKRRYILHVRLFDRVQQRTEESSTLTPSRFLSVIRQNSRLRYNGDIADEFFQQGVITFSPRNDSAPPRIMTLDPTCINYQKLYSLVDNCKEAHPTCNRCIESTSDLDYIKLIDCKSHDIIRGSLGMVYFALSYVWGQPNTTQRTESDQSKSSQISSPPPLEGAPSTVKDAILVVRNMGQRYLWVDKYCIDQDDENEKELMIGRMDQIYEHAEATIVAVDGENDECGLPGVSIPRILQPRLQTARWQFKSSCPPIKTLLNRSIWATRGWTYQEARLSGRCIFFTNHQVYFVCQQSTCSETIPTTLQDDWVSSLLNSGRLEPKLFGSSAPSLIGELCQDRYMFSQKRLTYGDDVLDAFRGILRRSPFVSFWGVPIIPLPIKMDANVGFALGLLWCRRPQWEYARHLREQPPAESVKLRVGFPTWSWTSIPAEIFNYGYGTESTFGSYLTGVTSEPKDNDADLRFWIMLQGEYIPLNDAILHHEKLLPEGNGSHQLQIEGYIVRLRHTDDNRLEVDDCRDLGIGFSAIWDVDVEPGRNTANQRDNRIDALILVNWNDAQKQTNRRLIMMLLLWVEEGVAERRGLVSDYRVEYSTQVLKMIPTTRRKFILK